MTAAHTSVPVNGPETMIYTVDIGNGHVMDIEGPPGATPEQLQAAAASHKGQEGGVVDAQAQTQGGFEDTLPDAPRSQMEPEDEAQLEQLKRSGTAEQITQFMVGKGFQPAVDMGAWVADRDKRIASGQPIDANTYYSFPKPTEMDTGGAGQSFARGIADSASLGGINKFASAVDAVGDKLSGSDKSFGDLYDYHSDVRSAVEQSDEDNHPFTRIAGQLLGGLAIPAGLEGVGLRAGTETLRAGGTMTEARAAARIAVTRRSAQLGGGLGATHGVLSADSPGEALTGALAEGAAGSLLGAAIPALGGKMADRAAARASAANASPQRNMIQAAGRIKLDDALLPADTGGPATRIATAVTAQTPLGAIPIVRAANNLNMRGSQVLQSQAQSLGDAAQDVEGLGTAAIEGAMKYNGSARRLGGRMYDAAVAKGGDVVVDLKSARDTLDSQIKRLSAVPGGGQGLDEAKALRAELNKPFTVQGIRDWRTEQFIDPKFRNTPVEGRMKAVVNAASRDVETALRSSGNTEAADLYAAADNNWREMLANLKRNVEPIVGNLSNLKSAEGVASALASASKNNGARLGAFVNSLPEEQRRIVSASFLAPLGRSKSGEFTISQFAQDWDKISPIAKRAAFPPETRAALNDLASVGNEAKRAMAYGNHSNSGGVIMADRLGGAVATAGTLALSLKTLGTALASQYGMGVLLASPKFARWLARAPRSQLSAPAYIDRLSRIARAEPAIANDVLQLQRRLTDAFSSAPTRMAAQEAPNEIAEGQGNAGQQQPQQQGFEP